MIVTDAHTVEVVVEHDPAGAGVVLQIGSLDAEGARTVRLTRDEARRLAGLILFQAARLERPGTHWDSSWAATNRRSA